MSLGSCNKHLVTKCIKAPKCVLSAYAWEVTCWCWSIWGLPLRLFYKRIKMWHNWLKNLHRCNQTALCASVHQDLVCNHTWAEGLAAPSLGLFAPLPPLGGPPAAPAFVAIFCFFRLSGLAELASSLNRLFACCFGAALDASFFGFNAESLCCLLTPWAEAAFFADFGCFASEPAASLSALFIRLFSSSSETSSLFTWNKKCHNTSEPHCECGATCVQMIANNAHQHSCFSNKTCIIVILHNAT